MAHKIKNLSVGGAQIVAVKELRPGQRVCLRLEFRKPRSFRVEAEGEVRWCRRDTRSVEPRWLAGILFVHVSLQDEGLLLEVARSFLGVEEIGSAREAPEGR